MAQKAVRVRFPAPAGEDRPADGDMLVSRLFSQVDRSMKSLAYWIQRADFSATDHEPIDVASALRAFDAHAWQDELNFQMELESRGREYCPPGMGFIDPDGPMLHVCP